MVASRALLSVATALLASTAGAGCADTTPVAKPGEAATSAATRDPQSQLERLLPLMSGLAYTYSVEAEDAAEDWLAQAIPEQGTRASLRLPGGTRHFEFVADGVRLLLPEGPVYVLKLPLAVGNRWRGARGSMVEVVGVEEAVELPAGRFNGCVRTLEVRGGDLPLRVATTYCPNVGIVQLDAASGQQIERGVLRSFGRPVDLGPDGVRRLP